jgi:hypothetical protein
MENNTKASVDVKPSLEKVSALLDELVKQFDEREKILNAV